MANDLTAGYPELWSRRMQLLQHKSPIYQKLANLEEKEAVSVGDTVHRPYRSMLSVNSLGSDGSYTVQDITDTDETLLIDQEKESTFQIKDTVPLFSKYHTLTKAGNDYADDQSRVLHNYVDAAFLSNMNTNAGGSLTAVTLSTSNVVQQFGDAMQKLSEQSNRNDLMGAGLWAIVSPAYFNILTQATANRATVGGDKVLENGFMQNFFGFDVYCSMALPHKATLQMATNPTAGDTITYDGVTFTFVATIGSTAGNVLIGASADATRANLETLVNAPGTTTATGVALSATASGYNQLSPRAKFAQFVTAANNNTTDLIVFTKVGGNRVTVSETLTAGADIWTAALQLQYNLFGFGKPTDMVIKRSPLVNIKEVSGKLALDFVASTVYGIKTFAEGATHIVSAPIRTDAM